MLDTGLQKALEINPALRNYIKANSAREDRGRVWLGTLDSGFCCEFLGVFSLRGSF